MTRGIHTTRLISRQLRQTCSPRNWKASGSSWPARRAHVELLRRDRETRVEAVSQLNRLLANTDGKVAALAGRVAWLQASTVADLDAERRTQHINDIRDELTPGNGSGTSTPHALRAAVEYLAQEPALPSVLAVAIGHPDARTQLAGIIGWFDVGQPIPDSLITGPRAKRGYVSPPNRRDPDCQSCKHKPAP